MISINIICVGKIKEKFFQSAIEEYSKRLSKYCKLSIIEVADEKTKENATLAEENLVKNKEGEKILSKIKEKDFVIALAIEGEKYDSVEFADYIEKLAISGNSSIDFVIGGSLGLSDEVKKRANSLLSFSDFTFPHQLMRVVLLEQIYRNFRIQNKEPYHK